MTRDMDIKNKLTVTRGKITRDRRGRSSRNKYKGHMDKAKGGRIEGRR